MSNTLALGAVAFALVGAGAAVVVVLVILALMWDLLLLYQAGRT